MSRTSVALPEIPGYSWRAIRHDDAAGYAALALRCAEVDNAPLPKPEDHDEQFDASAEVLAANTLCAANEHGELIASAWVTLDESMQHEYRAFFDGLVHPEFRGRGIGPALMRWMEAHAREVCAALPNVRTCVLRLDFFHENQDAIALFEQHGFRFVLAEDEMQRDLSHPIEPNLLPDDLSFVEWTPERAPLFFQVYTQAFRERPGFPGWPEEVWRKNLTGHSEFRSDLSLLILHENEGVGYALCAVEGSEATTGHIIQMGVVPAWRNRGLGGALLSETMRRFLAEGLQYATLEVNTNNPQATRVYERLGFVRSKRYASYRKTIDPHQQPSASPEAGDSAAV